MTLPVLSIIVTTYNWPQALECVLRGLSTQSYPDFEIIIADDGSKDETAQVIQTWQSKSPFPIIHCWQPDEGFRAAMSRNRAAAQAKNPYLVFLDGDCIPLPNFALQHAKLAEKGWFVAGNRMLLSQAFTQKVLREKTTVENWTIWQWLQARVKKQANHWLPSLILPLGSLRKCFPKRWAGAKTCNLGLWRADLIEINGLDETFQGWGFEDSDCVIRLQRAHIRRKSGKFAVPVCHLWHPSQDKTGLVVNESRLAQTLSSTHVKAIHGIGQYL